MIRAPQERLRSGGRPVGWQAAREDTHWRVSGRSATPRPGAILDRDGVLVEFVPYLHRTAETRLRPGVALLISRIRTAGGAVGVATNQAGIARTRYLWSDSRRRTRRWTAWRPAHFTRNSPGGGARDMRIGANPGRA